MANIHTYPPTYIHTDIHTFTTLARPRTQRSWPTDRVSRLMRAVFFVRQLRRDCVLTSALWTTVRQSRTMLSSRRRLPKQDLLWNGRHPKTRRKARCSRPLSQLLMSQRFLTMDIRSIQRQRAPQWGRLDQELRWQKWQGHGPHDEKIKPPGWCLNVMFLVDLTFVVYPHFGKNVF